jgi:hypothetical protein
MIERPTDGWMKDEKPRCQENPGTVSLNIFYVVRVAVSGLVTYVSRFYVLTAYPRPRYQMI